MKRLIILLLCVFVLGGCVKMDTVDTITAPEDNDLYDVVEIKQLSDHTDLDEYKFIQYGANMYEGFAIELFRKTIESDKNTIISPYSLYKALAVLANAASNDTRMELETVMRLTVNDMNNFLYDNQEWGSPKQSVNGLWLNQDKGLTLNQEFVDTINRYYGEDTIREISFKDQKLIEKVNDWAKEKTDGAIDNVLNDGDFDQSTILLLLNALATGGNWELKFDVSDTYQQTFNCYDGTSRNTDMMHQQLLGYWHVDDATGFVKRLDNGVNVVGILPPEGVDIYTYINNMPSDIFTRMIQSVVDYDNYQSSSQYGCTYDEHITNLSFPKFSFENEIDLTTPLKKMGLKNVFDYTQSDFSNLADGSKDVVDQLYIQKVKQKAMIEVDEEHVKAAAITVMPMGYGGDGCYIDNTYYYDVVFDRPFIFALCLYDSGPLFIGVVTELGN